MHPALDADFVLARAALSDGRAPWQYLSGGIGGKLLWTLLPERALRWTTEQQAELMLTEIGRPSEVQVRRESGLEE